MLLLSVYKNIYVRNVNKTFLSLPVFYNTNALGTTKIEGNIVAISSMTIYQFEISHVSLLSCCIVTYDGYFGCDCYNKEAQ